MILLIVIASAIWFWRPNNPTATDAPQRQNAAEANQMPDEGKSSEPAPPPTPPSILPMLDLPMYCLPVHDVKMIRGAVSRQFHARHPEFNLGVDDIELMFETVAEVGTFAAEPLIDFDLKTLRVTVEGRFAGEEIQSLAKFADKGDVEAALIYGSYLMHQGLRGDQKPTGINIDKLHEGERLLQYAYQNGRHEAIDRLFFYFNSASRVAWSKSGPSPDRHVAETARVAYSVWLLRNTTPGRALMVDNAYRNETVTSPSGDDSPTGEHHSLGDVAEKLSQIEQQFQSISGSQEKAAKRERMLWLNRYGLFEAFSETWSKDCSG